MMEIREISPEELNEAVELQTAAFADYDYFSVFVPNRVRRRHFIRHAVKSEMLVNMGKAKIFAVHDDGKMVASFVLYEPGYQRADDAEYLRAGFWKALLWGGYRNVAAWNDMEIKAAQPCHELTGKTWYLNALTVAKESEGKGYGSRIIQELIIPYVREHGGDTLCLYTNSEINSRFYLKNGFEEFHSQQFQYRGKTLGSWSYKMNLNGGKAQ